MTVIVFTHQGVYSFQYVREISIREWNTALVLNIDGHVRDFEDWIKYEVVR